MKINVYSIEKSQDPMQKKLIDEYIKMSLSHVDIADKVIFTKNIAKAQSLSSQKAQKSYTQAYEKELLEGANTLNISLNPNGKLLDSFEFADMLKDLSEVSFFIGGAWGFEEDFICKTKSISLSPLTMAHKVAKIVLFEQIFRALCIQNNHPYHK